MLGEYQIRKYDPSDKAQFLSIYDKVFEERSEDWFEWKYEDNPYIDEPPIFVAEETQSGEIVGARPHFPLQLRWEDETGIALQPCDTMVHPDHRRQGLFLKMTESAIEYFSEKSPWFFFNYPNNKSQRGNQKLGWKSVGEMPIWFRMNQLGKISEILSGGTAGQIGKITESLMDIWTTGLHTIQRVDTANVMRDDSPSPHYLSALSNKPQTNKITVEKDTRYFQWRFSRPDREYKYYTLSNGHNTGAGIITETSTVNGLSKTTIAESFPDESAEGLPRAKDWLKLLIAIVRDNEDVDLIRIFQGNIPNSILLRAGFLSGISPPLSVTSNPPELFARPLPESPIPDNKLFDKGGWQVSMAAWDTV